MILGFDPGTRGGYARIGYGSALMDWGNLPLIGKEWDYDLLRHIILNASVVIIEHVNCGAVPGRLSAFSFGKGFGVLCGMTAALEKPCYLVSAKTWQKAMLPGLPKKTAGMTPTQRKRQVKDYARSMAMRVRPQDSEAIRSMKDGPVDALLIAEWGRLTLGNSYILGK